MVLWNTLVPYLLGIIAIALVLAACFLKKILKFTNLYKHDALIFHWSFTLFVLALVFMYFGVSLGYKYGYEDSFPDILDGHTATVLAIYNPDVRHDSQDRAREKRCLLRLKDGRETTIKESDLYHGEINDIIIGDLVIKETDGPIYVLRRLNVARTIPASRIKSTVPFVDLDKEDKK